MSVIALSIHNLHKTYRNGFEALKGISLEVAAGDFFALLGPNGAGKSTLLNALTRHANPDGAGAKGTSVLAANMLFATLDPTTRRVQLPSGREMLVSDTVGFIQKLPTTLVAAFRATLQEAREADLLLHVVDVSDPYRVERQADVEAVVHWGDAADGANSSAG